MSKIQIWQSQIQVNAAAAADGWIEVCDIVLDSVNGVVATPSGADGDGLVAYAGNPDLIEIVVQAVGIPDEGVNPSIASFPDYTVWRLADGNSGRPAGAAATVPFADLALFVDASSAIPDLYNAETWLMRPQFVSNFGAVELRGGAVSHCFTPAGRLARLAFLPSNVPYAGIFYNVTVWSLFTGKNK